MRTLTKICIATIMLLTFGCASQSNRFIEEARREMDPERRISALEVALTTAVRQRSQSRVLMLRSELSKTALMFEMMPIFQRHSRLLLADINRLGVHQTTNEQQVLAYLGSIANNNALATGVTTAVKQAVGNICMLPQDMSHASFLVQAERKMSEACHALVTGEHDKAVNLSFLAYEMFKTASHQGERLPQYISTRFPGRSFLVRALQGRFCQEINVFCK